MTPCTNQTFLVPEGFKAIYNSSPGEIPKIFLVGEKHWSTYRKIIAEQLLNSEIVENSWFFCESMKSFRNVSEELKNEILSDLYISDEKKKQISLVTGWDTVDIYFNEEDPDRISTYLSAFVANIKSTINHLLQDLRYLLRTKGSDFQHLNPTFSTEKKLDWIYEKYNTFQKNFEQTIAHTEIEHHDAIALWQQRFKQFDLPFFGYPVLEKLKEIISKTREKIETDKNLIIHWTEEKLNLLAEELDEISTNLLSQIQTTLSQTEAFHEIILKERDESFPQRTESMKSTLLKIQEMNIEGRIFLIAGLKHLREDASDEKLSLKSVFQIIKEFRYPVIVLFPEILEKKDN